MEKNDVIKEVQSAFADVTLENGIGLWEAQAMDDYESIEVQKKARRNDEKEQWNLLEHNVLQSCHSSLSFFDANGMRFHLPAFIIGSLRDEVDDPIFHLVQLDDYAKSKLSTLSRAQRQAVVSYLRCCLEVDEYEFEHSTIQKALIEYWKE